MPLAITASIKFRLLEDAFRLILLALLRLSRSSGATPLSHPGLGAVVELHCRIIV